MAQHRTNEQKVADFTEVFRLIREEVTPPKFREVLTKLTESAPPELPEGADIQVMQLHYKMVEMYLGMVQQATTLSRMVTANDRAAAIVAGMLTQSGVARPVFTTDGDVD